MPAAGSARQRLPLRAAGPAAADVAEFVLTELDHGEHLLTTPTIAAP